MLIVEEGAGSGLTSEYVGIFVPRDTDVCCEYSGSLSSFFL